MLVILYIFYSPRCSKLDNFHPNTGCGITVPCQHEICCSDITSAAVQVPWYENSVVVIGILQDGCM